MGAKDLYLLQIIQYSSSETEPKPSHWAFYIHYTDKSSNLTGDGEIHEVLPIPQDQHSTSSSSTSSNQSSTDTQNAASPPNNLIQRYRYVKRRSPFLTSTFRGACTLALFYKKNLYKVLEALEYGSGKLNKKGDPNWTSKYWAEERLTILRRDGIVSGSDSVSISNMMRQAYKSWLAHSKELQEMREINQDRTKAPSDAGQVVKKHYSYPFMLYASV